MKVSVIIFLCIFSLFSCKTTNKKIKIKHSVKTLYTHLLKQDKIGIDPIVIFQNKNLGKLSLLNLEKSQFKNVLSSAFSFLEKNSIFYIMKFGEYAKDGVLIINNLLYLDTNAESYYLVDGNLVDNFLYEGIDSNKIDRLTQIRDLKDSNGNFLVLNIITFKKNKYKPKFQTKSK